MNYDNDNDGNGMGWSPMDYGLGTGDTNWAFSYEIRSGSPLNEIRPGKHNTRSILLGTRRAWMGYPGRHPIFFLAFHRGDFSFCIGLVKHVQFSLLAATFLSFWTVTAWSHCFFPSISVLLHCLVLRFLILDSLLLTTNASSPHSKRFSTEDIYSSDF